MMGKLDAQLLRCVLRIGRVALIALVCVIIPWRIAKYELQPQGFGGHSAVLTIQGYSYPVKMSLDGRGANREELVEVTLGAVLLPSGWEPIVEPTPEPITSYPWTIVAFDPPHHVICRRADGSLTAPLRADWIWPMRDESGDTVRWSDSGSAVHLLWLGRDAAFMPGSHWVSENVRSVLLRAVIKLIVGIGVGIIIAMAITSDALWITPIPSTCEKCGYDLRGSLGNKCPECGSLIDGEGRTAKD